MEENERHPLVYSHNFLGEVVHGSHGYRYVHQRHESPITIYDSKPNISDDIILNNDIADDNYNESEDNKSFLKTLKDSIKY